MTSSSVDDDWVLDGVFGFLTSPMWRLPVDNFIDEKCLVYGPSEENPHEFMKDHQLYGEMVEVLLETYLNDVGMSQTQFLEACSSDLTSFGRRHGVDVDGLFDQVRASTDFQIFKRILVDRNIAREVEALELHLGKSRKKEGEQKRMSGKKKNKKSGKNDCYGQEMSLTDLVYTDADDEALMIEVLRRSKMEYEEQRAEEEKEMKRACEQSEKDYRKSKDVDEGRSREESEREWDLLHQQKDAKKMDEEEEEEEEEERKAAKKKSGEVEAESNYLPPSYEECSKSESAKEEEEKEEEKEEEEVKNTATKTERGSYYSIVPGLSLDKDDGDDSEDDAARIPLPSTAISGKEVELPLRRKPEVAPRSTAVASAQPATAPAAPAVAAKPTAKSAAEAADDWMDRAKAELGSDGTTWQTGAASSNRLTREEMEKRLEQLSKQRKMLAKKKEGEDKLVKSGVMPPLITPTGGGGGGSSLTAALAAKINAQVARK